MARIRAPELVGRGWVGTGGRTLSLAELRGRFVLLDFWTAGCINCVHVLDELRPVESRWTDVLSVIGVHSPKFGHEAEPGAVHDAVMRLGVQHPVLDDADLRTWQAYAARAWPTLVLIDPDGVVVATYAGEGHAHAVDALLAALVPEAEARGLLRPGPPELVAPSASSDPLLFPAGAVRLPDGRWLVADTAHHRLVVLADDLLSVTAVVGSGERGLVDGVAEQARLQEPHGVCLLPSAVAEAVGYDVVVSDTVNHALRGLRLRDLSLQTVAGTGRAWSALEPHALSSPHGVTWWRRRVWVGMSGVHQLWTFDPVSGACLPAAGTRTEGLRDGPAAEAWFAQPSGLAADGDRLWVADPETSALRWVQDDGERELQVGTAVGTGLFDFGFADGTSGDARLQHPLGVALLPDRTVAVADTYNGAVRRYDPAEGVLSTMATGLREPAAVLADGEDLVVIESAAHRLVRVAAEARAQAPDVASRSQRAATSVAPGEVLLAVAFTPPPGEVLDSRYGPSTRLHVTATPPALLAAGEGAGSDLQRRLVLDPAVGEGVLHVSASAASCADGDRVGAACHLHQQDWGIPVVLDRDAPPRLDLALGGAG
jgi:thiol-disulfide isomerase/thioredoxin